METVVKIIARLEKEYDDRKKEIAPKLSNMSMPEWRAYNAKQNELERIIDVIKEYMTEPLDLDEYFEFYESLFTEPNEKEIENMKERRWEDSVNELIRKTKINEDWTYLENSFKKYLNNKESIGPFYNYSIAKKAFMMTHPEISLIEINAKESQWCNDQYKFLVNITNKEEE